MEWEDFSGTAEDPYKVVFPGLDCAFRQVLLVVVGGDELVGHLCFLYLSEAGGGYFIADNLLARDDVLEFHACKGSSPVEDHFASCPVFHGFNP